MSLRRQPGVRLFLPGLLAGECCGDTPAYVFRAFAVGRLLQRFGGNGRHVDVEVDAIEQRPRELAAIAADLVGGAAAAPGPVAVPAAGTGFIAAMSWKRAGNLA